MKRRVSQLKPFLLAPLVFWGNLFVRPRIPVLLYHSIDDSGSVTSVAPRTFREHMQYLNRRGYETISLAKYVEYLQTGLKPRKKLVAVTFDDGYKNNHTEAMPILRKYGFTATIFVATDYVGKTSSWARLDSIPELPLLSWSEIKEMNDLGIEFGSHTCGHTRLTQLSEVEMETELVRSKAKLEAKLNKAVTFFCHPYGCSDHRTRRKAKECGYLSAFGSLDFSSSNSRDSLYDLRRVGTAHFSSLWDFKAGLLGTYEWYIRMKRIFEPAGARN